MFKYSPFTDVKLTLENDNSAADDIRWTILLVVVAFFLLALALVFVIPRQTGAAPRDPAIRRTVYWVTSVVVPALVAIYYIMGCIHLFPPDEDGLNKHLYWTPIATIAAICGGVGLGYLLSRTVFQYSKLSDVFTFSSRR